MRVGSDTGAELRSACLPWPPLLSPSPPAPPPQAVRRMRAAPVAAAARMDVVPEIRMSPIVPLPWHGDARGIGVFRVPARENQLNAAGVGRESVTAAACPSPRPTP